MRFIQLRFDRSSGRRLVTAYEHDYPIYTASLVEMADWLERHGFTYVPDSKALWRTT